jgi:hypothetical protein
VDKIVTLLAANFLLPFATKLTLLGIETTIAIEVKEGRKFAVLASA